MVNLITRYKLNRTYQAQGALTVVLNYYTKIAGS